MIIPASCAADRSVLNAKDYQKKALSDVLEQIEICCKQGEFGMRFYAIRSDIGDFVTEVLRREGYSVRRDSADTLEVSWLRGGAK